MRLGTVSQHASILSQCKEKSKADIGLGNGQQTDVEPDDDSDPDAEGESDDDESDEILQDWGLLYFMWNENDAVSQCVFQGNQQRLIYQRPDQGWVNDILSRRHHATHDRITTDIRYGGLIGDLGIIIGLIALSVRHGRVDETVQHCLRAVGGDTGGWRRPRRTDVRRSNCRVCLLITY